MRVFRNNIYLRGYIRLRIPKIQFFVFQMGYFIQNLHSQVFFFFVYFEAKYWTRIFHFDTI